MRAMRAPFVLVLVASAAFAQAPPSPAPAPLTLPQLQELARKNDPRTGIARAQVDGARSSRSSRRSSELAGPRQKPASIRARGACSM